MFAALPLGAVAQQHDLADSAEAHNGEYAPKQRATHDERRWNNDIRVNIGAPGPLTYILLLDFNMDKPTDTFTASDRLAAGRYYEGPTYFLPPISLEYGRYVNKWLVVGAKASFTGIFSSMRHIATNKRFSTDGEYILSTVVNLRFDYLRRDIVSLYSGIGLGITTKISYDYNMVAPMFDVTYFGITVGKNIFGFAELGGGGSGCLRCGIGGRF